MSSSPIDYNLLPFLSMLLEERSVTKAAARAGMTQSAMSHVLRRLRVVYDDQLLVRSGGGMALTPMAQRLAPEVEAAIRRLHLLLATSEQLGCSEPHGDVRAAAEPDLVPLVRQVLALQLPVEVRATVVQAATNPAAEVREGRACIGVVAEGDETDPSGLVALDLSAGSWAVLARRGAEFEQHRTLDSYQAAVHLCVGSGSEPAPVVESLGPVAVVHVDSLASAARVTARSDLLVTAPRASLKAVAEPLGLVICDLPLGVAPAAIRLLVRDEAACPAVAHLRVGFEGSRQR